MNVKPELKERWGEYLEMHKNNAHTKQLCDCIVAFGEAVDNGETFPAAFTAMKKKTDGLNEYAIPGIMRNVIHFHERGEEIKTWWNERNMR